MSCSRNLMGMSRSDGEVGSVDGLPEGASNVLLLAPSMAAESDEACRRLLCEGGAHVDALSVALTGTPDDRLAVCRAGGGDGPAKMGFVSVGETTRSAAAAAGGPVELPGGEVVVETVSSPADLTGLGIKISGFLSRWEGDGNRIHVCVHSLTTLLQYVDVQDVFRFLHVVTGRLDAVSAVAHYHMDPTAHTDQEVNTLKSLFDAVIELDDDGEWSVVTR